MNLKKLHIILNKTAIPPMYIAALAAAFMIQAQSREMDTHQIVMHWNWQLYASFVLTILFLYGVVEILRIDRNMRHTLKEYGVDTIK